MADKEPEVLPARVLEDDEGLGVGLAPSAQLFLQSEEDTVQMSYEQERDAQNLLTPKQRLFLYALCRTGTLAGASSLLRDQATGKPMVSVARHARWMGSHPEYRRLYEELEQAILARWEEKFLKAADHGLEEKTFDGEGKLTQRKVRQDARMMHAVMAAKHPEYRDNSKNNTINVVIVRTDE